MPVLSFGSKPEKFDVRVDDWVVAAARKNDESRNVCQIVCPPPDAALASLRRSSPAWGPRGAEKNLRGRAIASARVSEFFPYL